MNFSVNHVFQVQNRVEDSNTSFFIEMQGSHQFLLSTVLPLLPAVIEGSGWTQTFPECQIEKLRHIPRPISTQDSATMGEVIKCMAPSDVQDIRNNNIEEIWYLGEDDLDKPTLLEARIAFRYSGSRQILGSGSFGSVFKAWDYKSRREVAIKNNLDKDFTGRQEYEFMRQFESPFTMSALDYYETEDKTSYVIMPVMQTSLQAYIDGLRGKYRWNLDDVQKVLFGLLSAIKSVESTGLVFRDLKPANILCNTEPRLTCKLSDFQSIRPAGELFDIIGMTQSFIPHDAWLGRSSAKIDTYAIGLTGLFMVNPECNAGRKMKCETQIYGVKRFMKKYAKKKMSKNKAEQLVSLLEGLLAPRPKDRLGPEQALAHPFFKGFNYFGAALKPLQDVRDKPQTMTQAKQRVRSWFKSHFSKQPKYESI